VEDHCAVTTRSQFCPVVKAAEVFCDRWTPIIIRELCFGTRSFGQLLEAAPLYRGQCWFSVSSNSSSLASCISS
jgi:hypothetical protein